MRSLYLFVFIYAGFEGAVLIRLLSNDRTIVLFD